MVYYRTEPIDCTVFARNDDMQQRTCRLSNHQQQYYKLHSTTTIRDVANERAAVCLRVMIVVSYCSINWNITVGVRYTRYLLQPITSTTEGYTAEKISALSAFWPGNVNRVH
jgi:hypothetical protein